jgi:hypothetical protein
VLRLGSFQPTHVLQTASNDGGFKVVTNKWVVSSAILSGIVAGVGLIFFALFIWRRKTLDPPSYVDLEKGQTMEPGEKSPELPIQPAGKTSPGFKESTLYVQYSSHESWAERKRGHSRNGSNASSITVNEFAYDSYWETLPKRAWLTSSVVSTDGTYLDSSSDRGSKGPGHTNSRSRENSVGSVSSMYSELSRYNHKPERIFIGNVRLPPQFSTPMRPPSAVS